MNLTYVRVQGVKTIAIHTRHRTYKLQAESEEMSEWIDVLHTCVRDTDQSDSSSRRARKIEALATAQTMEITYKASERASRFVF